MTWEIFLGLGALVSFMIAIITPLIKLNTSITKLNSSVSGLKESIDRIEKDNKANLKEVWDHNDEQDKAIAENTKKIHNLEHAVVTAEQKIPELQGISNQLHIE